MLGTLYTDTLTLSDGVVIQGQSIGVGSAGPVLRAANGVLGLGPRILTVDTLLHEPDMLIPTVIDNLLIQGDIDQLLFPALLRDRGHLWYDHLWWN